MFGCELQLRSRLFDIRGNHGAERVGQFMNLGVVRFAQKQGAQSANLVIVEQRHEIPSAGSTKTVVVGW